MGIIEALQHSPLLWMCVSGLLGLMVGSFLNVVIHRLPRILEREWREQGAELSTGAAPGTPYSLLKPRSHCPHCTHVLRAWENIPVVSYLLQRGRCRACRAPIARRYPIVELAGGLVALLCALRFGVTPQAGAAMVLGWGLLALAVIDLDHQLLPDRITLPLLWLGLLLSTVPIFAAPVASIAGAAAGYLALWTVYQIFKHLTGKEGMGYGDFKLLAALGAWLGWQQLPLVLLLSSFSGALVGLALVIFKRHDRAVPIPFGPYLAAAGFLALLSGGAMTSAYLDWLGT